MFLNRLPDNLPGFITAHTIFGALVGGLAWYQLQPDMALIQFLVLIGLFSWLPDIDLLFNPIPGFAHRSWFTHSLAIPTALHFWFSPELGLYSAIGIGSHLIFDFIETLTKDGNITWSHFQGAAEPIYPNWGYPKIGIVLWAALMISYFVLPSII